MTKIICFLRASHAGGVARAGAVAASTEQMLTMSQLAELLTKTELCQ